MGYRYFTCNILQKKKGLSSTAGIFLQKLSKIKVIYTSLIFVQLTCKTKKIRNTTAGFFLQIKQKSKLVKVICTTLTYKYVQLIFKKTTSYPENCRGYCLYKMNTLSVSDRLPLSHISNSIFPMEYPVNKNDNIFLTISFSETGIFKKNIIHFVFKM